MDEQNIQKELLLRLIYSEVFQHPLTSYELELLVDCTPTQLKHALDELGKNGLVQQKDDHYYIFEEGEKITKRISGNKEAKKMMPKAQQVGRKIFRFPYVEGVGISGSLSKGVLHSDGDFDYFIITQPNRLWVARTLLILYKKIFLFNSRKHFCVNYFIDSQNLEIEEKNPFTATEISTLIPIAGNVMDHFFEQNAWIDSYLRKNEKQVHFDKLKKPAVTRAITFIMKGKFGEFMDRRFMRITLKRWERKFGTFEPTEFELAMKSRKYVSKHHPNNFQDKVLNRLEELTADFKNANAERLNNLGIEL